MPRTCRIDPRFEYLLSAQDFVVHRRQAIAAGLTADALDYRLGTRWQRLLPSVYFTQLVEPSRRQRMIAALLYAGARSAIDGVDACHFYGIKAVRPDDRRIHVVVPRTRDLRSTDWLVIRRTSRPYSVRTTARLRYVDPATAVMAAAGATSSPRTALAILSDALQRGLVDIDGLSCAQGRGARHTAALAQLRAGIRSVGEAAFRTLAEDVPGLPTLIYNPLLQLPNGARIRPDAIAPDAPLIHETNGVVAHRRQDLFEDMQRRHDALTTAGFTVLHNTPRRIRDQAQKVIQEFEQCYRRLAGSGWPAGVVLLDDGKKPASIPVFAH